MAIRPGRFLTAKLRLGETAAAARRREVREETGLDIVVGTNMTGGFHVINAAVPHLITGRRGGVTPARREMTALL